MMKTIKYPETSTWAQLTQRPEIPREVLTESVQTIIDDVARNGDNALRRYTKQLDGAELTSFKVSESALRNAEALLSKELKDAIQIAASNIDTFHKSQVTTEPKVETQPGVSCWRKSVGIEKVGLYIPGGSAPLFSTVLMLGIPAKIAGCSEILLCTPPNSDGSVNPAILYAAQLVGIDTIYSIGGAQAIAALALGTQSIPRVDKIFGPGNQYVTKAKELVQGFGTAIDMPAGPSELLIVADDTAVASFVAADLLSQAEHGPDSQVLLVTTSEQLAAEVNVELPKQLAQLSRKAIAEKAINNSTVVLLKRLEDCLAFSNSYAPEHLIIATEDAVSMAQGVRNAGSVFLGNYSCESAGDYASGTNHSLPTNGFARSYSGVSVDSFVRKITFQQITQKGLKNIGPAIEQMAAAENLEAHKNAVTLRLKNTPDENN